MIKIVHKWFRSCLNLVYPLKCVVCDSYLSIEESSSEHLCSSCFQKIKFIVPPICEKCGKPSNSPVCSQCNKKSKIFFDRAFSVAAYEGVLRELIHFFKYNKGDYFDEFLARFIAEIILKTPELKDADLVVPVPMHWFDKYRRGYNQTELLACEVSKIIGMPMLTDRLIKCRRIPSQTTLSREERVKNVKGAFKLKNSKIIKGKKILLIDDVFTTGSTANECAKALFAAKAEQINVITLACTCEI